MLRFSGNKKTNFYIGVSIGAMSVLILAVMWACSELLLDHYSRVLLSNIVKTLVVAYWLSAIRSAWLYVRGDHRWGDGANSYKQYWGSIAAVPAKI